MPPIIYSMHLLCYHLEVVLIFVPPANVSAPSAQQRPSLRNHWHNSLKLVTNEVNPENCIARKGAKFRSESTRETRRLRGSEDGEEATEFRPGVQGEGGFGGNQTAARLATNSGLLDHPISAWMRQLLDGAVP